MPDTRIEDRLAELGITLPALTPPVKTLRSEPNAPSGIGAAGLADGRRSAARGVASLGARNLLFWMSSSI